MEPEKGERRWTFEDLVEPVGIDAFMSRSWSREFLHMRGREGRFAELFGWAHLEKLLAEPSFPPEHLRVFRDGKEVDRATYFLAADERLALLAGSLVNLLGAGATLILDHLQMYAHGPAGVARACEAFLGASTTVNLYAGWRRSAGFKVHWDWQDTIILQVAGRKSWSVYGPTRVDPLRHDTEKPIEPAGEPVWSGILEDGDALYLPRGWWHVAQPLDEPTLHLTVTIVPDTGASLAVWLAARAGQLDGMRKNVPARMSDSERREFGCRFREMLEQLASDHAIAEFLAQRSAARTVPGRPQLPMSPYDALRPIGPQSVVRLAVDRKVHVVEDGRDPVAFYVNGARWTCAAALLPALRALENERGTPLQALLETLPDAQAKSDLARLMGALALAGAVWVESSTH